MKKMTQKEENAAVIEHMRQNFPEVCIAQPLYDLTEALKMQVAEMKLVKAIPAQVEVLAAMERALSELDALNLKYFPDEVEQAA